MRAGKVPLNAISGTVTFFDGAAKVMKGLASAAQAVVDEASKTAQSVTAPKPPAPPALPPDEDATGRLAPDGAHARQACSGSPSSSRRGSTPEPGALRRREAARGRRRGAPSA